MSIISLLSPKTILGIYLFLAKKNDPYTIELPMACLTWSAILPCIMTCMILDYKKNDIKYRMLSLSIFSPLVIGAIYETNPIFKATYNRLVFMNKGRQEPLPYAQSLYHQLVQDGQIDQYDKYDVYAPSKRNKSKALLIIPGFLINHTAYVEIAKLLSEKGILVIVLSLEPLRVATSLLGANQNTIKKIIKEVNENYSNDIEWNICGHSLGGYAASEIHSILPTFKKLILWGSGSFPTFLTNLRDSNREMLIVLATNDRVCNFDKEGSYEYFLSMCPPEAKFVFCHGGNHCQFASYDDRVFDGIATLSRKKQHDFVCRVTSKFLLD